MKGKQSAKILPSGTKHLKLNANVKFRTATLPYVHYAEVNCGGTQNLN